MIHHATSSSSKIDITEKKCEHVHTKTQCHQIRTIFKSQLTGNLIGTISIKAIEQIEAAIVLYLDIN